MPRNCRGPWCWRRFGAARGRESGEGQDEPQDNRLKQAACISFRGACFFFCHNRTRCPDFDLQTKYTPPNISVVRARCQGDRLPYSPPSDIIFFYFSHRGGIIMAIQIDGHNLTVEKVVRVARENEQIELDPEAKKRIEKCRALLEDKIQKGG